MMEKDYYRGEWEAGRQWPSSRSRSATPPERQMRIEFSYGLRIVITEASPVALAASLIENLCAGKGVSR